MKKKRIKTILVFLLVIIITSTLVILEMLYHYNYKYTFKLSDNKITVSINSKLDPLDYVEKLNNVKVLYDNIDTTKVGTSKIKYTVVDKFNRKHIYYLEVTVVDDRVYEEPEKVEVVEQPKKEEPTIKNTVSMESSKGYEVKQVNGAYYVNNILVANKTFPLSSNYGSGLTSETNNAFEEMKAAALLDGYNIYIASGYRSYSTQSKLYNRYVNRDGKKAADTYSARPGHSEHQTGLAFDVCDRNIKACINSNFNNTNTAKWLSDNAYKYGFILRYPQGKTNETGYVYESWHFRYIGKEIASELYNNGNWITLENYLGITSSYSD